MTRYVALLRAINVGGHRKVPMAELRMLAQQIGLARPRTYVASGNLVFESEGDGDAVESALERAVEARFGFHVDIIVCSAEQWAHYAQGNPFPEESEASPNLVMISIGKAAPDADELAALRLKASAKEKIVEVGDAIWIYFGEGAGRSRIGTGPVKSIATTRNWRSVVKIGEMLAE